MSRCGCPCVCHTDEAKPEWPGPCEACCDPELELFTCSCVRILRVAQAAYTEWYNGNLSEVSYDRLLAAAGVAHESLAKLMGFPGAPRKSRPQSTVQPT